MQSMQTCLWFDGKAEEAAELYVSLFPNSRILAKSYHDDATAEASGVTSGLVLTVTFELNGNKFMALNGGPMFKPTEAVSLMAMCKTQAEIDRYWNGLIADGGEESMCGWLKDKYGFSWQICPELIVEVFDDPNADPEGRKRMMAEVMQMNKLDLATLEKAYRGA